ncbi:pentapeptide repeat-containing protein [Aminipila terrae]|uniref:Pentapeptide repeat-containing protein n=1 Tax=Aminipila terrae TaxID=2697030 RepID=A0A6P1MFP5_9FIRM|nr:pentapeptide repeat-containing protein [Aminipila terrae]QHI72717.1 hypothetical protein Ami3637_10180 [Aminipila terrae]
MKNKNLSCSYKELLDTLSIKCEECCGLCCTALYYAKTDGFPEDKAAGNPCMNLQDDFKCGIHEKLTKYNLKGCRSYDCFGAGQKVTQTIYKGMNWRNNPQIANQMYQVYLTVYQYQQMLWYLIQAAEAAPDNRQKDSIDLLVKENIMITRMEPERILASDVEKYRGRVNSVLKEVCKAVYKTQKKSFPEYGTDCMGKNFRNEETRGRDFSMTLLIAANFEGCDLKQTNFLGADMRDVNLKNADLSESLFLTQMQINTALGNKLTKLPEYISRPETWQ